MDEQVAEAPVDFHAETAEGKHLVDKLVDLSPKLSAVKNLVRCLNLAQRDVEARERLLLQTAINGMSQLGLVVPSIAIQQHLERVIDDTDFAASSEEVRSAASLLSATKPPATSDAEIGLWSLQGSDANIAKIRATLILRARQMRRPPSACRCTRRDRDGQEEPVLCVIISNSVACFCLC